MLLDSNQWLVVGSYASAYSTVGQWLQCSFPSIICGNAGAAYFTPFFMLLSCKRWSSKNVQLLGFESESWDFFSSFYAKNYCLWKRGPNSVTDRGCRRGSMLSPRCAWRTSRCSRESKCVHVYLFYLWGVIYNRISIVPCVLMRNGVSTGVFMHLKHGWFPLKPINNF